MSETNTFATAVRNVESADRYDQIKGQVRSSRLIGAYGFPGDEWKQMAVDNGLAGARWTDPRAQDEVAKRIFDQLYRKYGDWRLVAVAWKAGEDIADRVAENAQLLNDPKLKGVKEYVTQVMQRANDDIVVNKPVMPDGSPITQGRFQTTTRGLPGTSPDEVPPGRATPREALTAILRGMKAANLRRSPDPDTELDAALVDAEAVEAEPEPEPEPEQPGLMDRLRGRA